VEVDPNTALNQTIPPGGSVELFITFAPTEEKVYTGTFTIDTDANDISISVSGTGVGLMLLLYLQTD